MSKESWSLISQAIPKDALFKHPNYLALVYLHNCVSETVLMCSFEYIYIEKALKQVGKLRIGCFNMHTSTDLNVAIWVKL